MTRPRISQIIHRPLLYLLIFCLLTSALADHGLADSRPSVETLPSGTWNQPSQREDHLILDELRQLEKKITEAQTERVSSRTKLRKARQRRYPRGQALDDLRKNAQEDEIRMEKLENLFLHLVEGARRQGVPLAALSPFLDRAEALEDDRTLRTN